METASLNLANLESAAPAPDQVYRPKRVRLNEVFDDFQKEFDALNYSAGVQAEVATQPESSPIAVHDPTHPDADQNGMVLYPDIDMSSEMAELMAARRAYEAGLAAYTQSKEIFISTLEIIRA